MRPVLQCVILAVVACVASAIGFGTGLAQERAPLPRVQCVLTQPLDDVPGREVRMEVVTFAPGSDSPPHRHPGHVFVYVLEGAIESALEDGDAIRYEAGDTFYEPANGLHRVTRNPSESVSAKILAVMLVGERNPSTKLDLGHTH